MSRSLAGAVVCVVGGSGGLVNAIGIVGFGSLLDTPDELIEESFLTNVLGPLWMLRRVLPCSVNPMASSCTSAPSSPKFVAEIIGSAIEAESADLGSSAFLQEPVQAVGQ